MTLWVMENEFEKIIGFQWNQGNINIVKAVQS